MANYVSRHTGQTIDDAIDLVGSNNIGNEFKIRIIEYGNPIPSGIDLTKEFLVLLYNGKYYPLVSAVSNNYAFGVLNERIFETIIYTSSGSWIVSSMPFLKRQALVGGTPENTHTGEIYYNSTESAYHFITNDSGDSARFYSDLDNVALLYRTNFTIASTDWSSLQDGSTFSYTVTSAMHTALSNLRQDSLILINHSVNTAAIVAEASNGAIKFTCPTRVNDSVQMGWFNDS